MRNCLLTDFGSTFTKLTAVNLVNEKILGVAQSKTTISSNIIEGYNVAKKNLLTQLNQPNLTFDLQLACSSAKGGFRMIAVGLSSTLTAEAARRVALSAGTRILKVYSYGLKEKDIEEIQKLSPDIILVSGGTNGGNTTGIIHDVELLTTLDLIIPIVVAGNQTAYPEIKKILSHSKFPFYLTENVMPQINVLNPDPTREILRNVFMEKIVEAKGMSSVVKEIGPLLMPTPTAVLQAAELLAKGTSKTIGMGNLIIVDIGGATTDIHSVGEGKPSDKSIYLKGLQEPYAKRTVEGDLGMRYSALSLFEATSQKVFSNYTTLSLDAIEESCVYRSNHPEMVASTSEEIEFDEILSKVAIDLSFSRHAGRLSKETTPNRVNIYQTGKDLNQFKHIIGTGGILVNSQNPKNILRSCLKYSNDMILKPIDSNFYLDKSYLLSAMGLLAQKFPETALKIMKNSLLQL